MPTKFYRMRSSAQHTIVCWISRVWSGKRRRKHVAAAAIFRVTNGVACGVIFLAGALVVSAGGYVLLGLVNATPRAPAQMTQVFGHEPSRATAVTTGLSAASGDWHTDRSAIFLKLSAHPGSSTRIRRISNRQRHRALLHLRRIQPARAASVPLVRDFAANDAKHYRERGISAYRIGDLHLALVDFDLAIQYDPSSPDTYIDRAIVFYRMGDRKRAFADIAEAKRIHHELNRNKTLSTASSP